MANHFDTMKHSIDEAAIALHRRNDPKRSREIFRSFMSNMFASIEGLAYQLGADGSYLSDEFLNLTGKNGQVDSAFLELVDGVDDDEVAARYAHKRAMNSIVYDRARA